MNKNIIWTIIIAALVSAIVVVIFPHSTNLGGAVSPAGVTYSTRAIVEQTLNDSSSTVYAQTNNGADKIITSIDFFAVNGAATTTNYALQCATSSNATTPVNSNLILNQALSGIGTTTGNSGMYFSSSSPGLSGLGSSAASTTARVWKNGETLECSTTQTTSTNSLNTLDPATTGVITVGVINQ